MMLIYNVTIQVDENIEHEWLQWMRDVHIPDVLATNCFHKYQLVKLLDQPENTAPTYAVQYFTDTIELYNEYINTYAEKLRNDGLARWGDSFVAFRTLMEVLD